MPPIGLRRKPYIAHEINYNPSCGMRMARKLMAQGLVTIRYNGSGDEPSTRTLKSIHWAEYEVTPTVAGLAMLDEYEAQFK